MPACSTGQMLRAEAATNSVAGYQLRYMLASGSLLPDELVCTAVASRLQRDVPASGIILDGFPRTVAQAKFLDGLLGDLGMSRPEVIHLDVPQDLLLKRLTARRQCSRCGEIYNLISRPSAKGRLCEKDHAALVQRDDDTEGVILHRFSEYEALSAPLIRYYAGERYHRLDGSRSASEISRDLAAMMTREAAMAA